MHLYAFVQAAEIWVKTESHVWGHLDMGQALVPQTAGRARWPLSKLPHRVVKSAVEMSPRVTQTRAPGRPDARGSKTMWVQKLQRLTNAAALTVVHKRETLPERSPTRIDPVRTSFPPGAGFCYVP